MTKTKTEFIIDLLNYKGLDTQKKERIFILLAKELQKDNKEIAKIWEEIERLKKNENDKVDNQKLIHNPKAISIFLNEFRQNTALKFSTHIWDKTDFLSSIDKFLEKLNEEKKQENFGNLFNYNRQLYNLINYFLFSPSQKIENNIPKYGWEGMDEIKIGWQFPNDLLRNWCYKNYDNQNNPNRKYPLEFPIPDFLKPKKRIKGKEINYFEDVVNLFKTEIQFRGEENNFFNNVKFLLNKNNLYSSNIDLLDKLDFYTYTRGVINAIEKIFNTFQKNNEAKKEIIFGIVEEINCFALLITQLDSYPAKKLDIDKPTHFFGGDTISISNHLYSLCDYSIISNFNNSKFLEIEILKEGTEAILQGKNIKKLITDFEVKEVDPKIVKGFTHKLRFYI